MSTNTDKNEQIMKILEEQVINKTLNLEGISMVQKIIEEYEALKKGTETDKKIITQYKETEQELRENLNIVNRELEAAKMELVGYKAKEKTYYEEGVKFQYEQERGAELREIVDMALRNPVITKSRFGGISGSYPDQNGYIKNDNTNETETETTG